MGSAKPRAQHKGVPTVTHFENPGPVEENWKDAISSVEEILDDARNGRMFILVDHEDRENEGDLVI
ncbi:MAG: 3,4-dihydroxy-2-butanone-4-phosphate synthase, partial [Primorskyibacter sp.]